MGDQIAKAVALGQILSLLITGTSFSTSQLVRQGINTPMTQVFFINILLAGVYGSLLLYRRKPLKSSWYLYLVFAIIDVEGNYLVTKAYQYTSITSAMLLDCWSIPVVLFLTWLVFNTQYFRGHYVGVCTCVLGLLLVVFSDVHAEDRAGGGSAPLLGDIFMVVGATLYGINNVYEEFLVQKVDRVELLALIGGFGAIFSGLQVLLVERHELESIQWSANVVVPFIGYSVCFFSFSTLLPVLLKIGGSTMFNLSLLTSDMYGVAIRWLIYEEPVDWLYFVAFATVAVGLTLYSRSGEVRAAALENEGAHYEKLESGSKDAAMDGGDPNS